MATRGRPAKSAEEKRGIVRKVRFSTHEDDRVRRDAADMGLTVSAFCRAAVLSHRRLTTFVEAAVQAVAGPHGLHGVSDRR